MQAQTDSLVLVIDDDPASLRLTEQILLSAGYWNLRLYGDPRSALNDLDLPKVDLIVSDVQMPELDGLQLLQQIRLSVPEDEFLPFLVITADATTETRRKALMLGADDFLTKPIDVVETTLRVKHLLQLRTLHKELSYARHTLASEVEARTSDLEAAMGRLESLVKAKDVFIASVSHELRTPLTAVLGYAAEMAGEPERMSREEVAGAARLIYEQATDLSAIIDDLLVAARSDINAVQVLREEVDLGEELAAVLQGVAETERTRVQVAPGSPVVEADHLRTRQILRNLLTNALRHGGDRVSIELGERAGFGYVTVADDGPSIPEESRRLLFEPYFHGNGDSSQPQSIGLGLTVSRFLARLMQGDLTLEEGREGTAFVLTLPAVTVTDRPSHRRPGDTGRARRSP